MEGGAGVAAGRDKKRCKKAQHTDCTHSSHCVGNWVFDRVVVCLFFPGMFYVPGAVSFMSRSCGGSWGIVQNADVDTFW